MSKEFDRLLIPGLWGRRILSDPSDKVGRPLRGRPPSNGCPACVSPSKESCLMRGV